MFKFHTLAAYIAGIFIIPAFFVPAFSYAQAAYQLGSGDKVRITVFGEPDLTGEFEVDGTGILALPLIGQIRVGGLSLRQVENNIEAGYRGDYLVNPQVSAEVLNFRPFFILGEVNTPGNYPFISGMNVLNAVAVAGGYSYRANKKKITLKSSNSAEEKIVDEFTKVQPGDVLHVHERFF